MKAQHALAILLVGAATAYVQFAIPVQSNSCHASRTQVQPDPKMLKKYEQIIANTGAKQSGAGFSACFAPGTDPATIAAFEEAMGMQGLDYRTFARWPGAQNTPIALTWSLVPDGTMIDGVPSNLFAKFDFDFATQGGRTVWMQRISHAIKRWGQLTGLSFTYVKNGNTPWDDGAAYPGSPALAGVRGDIRIGGRNIDGVGNILATNYFPAFGGDMTLDTSDSGYYNDTANFNRGFRNTLIHEVGHGTGLAHVDSDNFKFVMEPVVQVDFDGPQHDDIRGNQYHYGDIHESNNTFGTATDLGDLAVPSTTTFGAVPADSNYPSMPIPANSSTLAISGNLDSDWYLVTLPANTTLAATVTPVGMSYLEGAPGETQTTINSKAQTRLGVAHYNTNGTSVMTFDLAGVEGETVSTTSLINTAGNYFVQVYEGGSPTTTQQYSLKIETFASRVLLLFATLQDWPKSRNSEITLTGTFFKPGETTPLGTLALTDPEEDGIFQAKIPGNWPANLKLLVNGNRWLSVARSITLVSGIYSATMTFTSGDCVDSDSINTDDYLALNTAFDTGVGQPRWNPLCDFNGDDYVGTDDYLVLNKNFDMNGDE